jgi:DnaK suppressor protein
VLLLQHDSIRGMNTQSFKEKLEIEKKGLEEELGQIAIFNTETNMWDATPDQDMMGEIDDNDAADRFEDFEERSAMVTTLQSRLIDLDIAIAKIGTDKFGKCEVCGEPIEADRLEANPAARKDKTHMNEN